MKGYRTLIANTLASIVPIMELTEWTDVMPDEWLPWYALALALANMWLRAITTTPMGVGRPPMPDNFSETIAGVPPVETPLYRKHKSGPK